MARSVAREKFLARMEALALASKSDDLQGVALTAQENDPARLLRNGLAVVGYAAFEDFFVKRCLELLSTIDPVRLPFERLPDKLKAAATWGAVQTLVSRARMDKDATSRMALIQAHSAELASTASSNYRLSELSFAPTGSNLSFEDLDAALKALAVEGPWVEMGKLASRAGYGVAGLSQILKGSAANRHEAAHLAEADMALADIQELPTNLTVIGFCFDALPRQAVDELPAVLGTKSQKNQDASTRVSLRFIDQHGGRYKECRETVARAQLWSDNLKDALAAAAPRAATHAEVLVVRDSQGLPIQWHMP